MKKDDSIIKAEKIALRRIREWKKFRKDHLDGGSHQATMILKYHLYIERSIDEIIANLFPRYRTAINTNSLTFYHKILIFHSLGLDHSSSNILVKLKRLNSLRNKLSHELNFSLTRSDIKEMIHGVKAIQRSQNITQQLEIALVYMTGYLESLQSISEIAPFKFFMMLENKSFDNDDLKKEIMKIFPRKQFGTVLYSMLKMVNQEDNKSKS